MVYFREIPDYVPALDRRETERAIKFVKDVFESELAAALHLERISAPMFVRSGSGINDDLSGTERPVRFDIPAFDITAEIVHSLAKWKRMALNAYGYRVGEGIYTDMNAIRRDDDVGNLHSIYVDQWDWEKCIERSDRTLAFLYATVEKIVGAIVDTQARVQAQFGQLKHKLHRDVRFFTSEELRQIYPDKSPKEREYEIVKKHRTVFVSQIGGVLGDGKRHDGRAPDYDDWTLNGDLLFWQEALGAPMEISSMGVRVDAEALQGQLAAADESERLRYPYHAAVANDALPLTIGGGIGQSRLCMLLLEKVHIGEVQVSLWPEEMQAACRRAGIPLL